MADPAIYRLTQNYLKRLIAIGIPVVRHHFRFACQRAGYEVERHRSAGGFAPVRRSSHQGRPEPALAGGCPRGFQNRTNSLRQPRMGEKSGKRPCRGRPP